MDDEECTNISRPKATLTKYFEDFSGYTTLHGLQFVFGTGGFIRRLIWLILVLTGLGLCVKQLIVSFGKLRARETVISQAIIPSEQLTFPAVTICNMNMMKKSSIRNTEAQVFLDKLNIMFTYKTKNRRNLSRTFDIQQAVKKHGHKRDEVIGACAWDSKKCSYLNFTTRFSYLYGLCYTFNSGQTGQPLSSISAKQTRGLNLMLRTSLDEYYGMSSYVSTGMRMTVHNQNEEPMVEDDGIDIMAGYKTTIALKRMQFNSLPHPYKSACGSKNLETSKVYSTKTCLMECSTHKVIKKCGCKLLGMPNITESSKVKYCFPDTMMKCGVYSGYFNQSANSSATMPLVTSSNGYLLSTSSMECKCSRPCKEITYSSKVSIANYLSDAYKDDLIEWNAEILKKFVKDTAWIYNFSKTKIEPIVEQSRKDNIHLSVHYQDLNTYVTTERPSYDINNFGADVGGYIGLFLGCSVLTVFEFIDFLIVYCCRRRLGRKMKPSEVENQSTEQVVKN